MHSEECRGMKPLSTAKARQRDVVPMLAAS